MNKNSISVSVKGKLVPVPFVSVEERDVIVQGKWIKVGAVKGEDWIEGDVVKNPETFIRALSASAIKADIFTFSQKFSDPEPRFKLRYEWDNVAAIPITTFDAWWNSLSQEGRKNVRRAERRGVVTKAAAFDDAFVQGIKDIYDETPIRQGRKFWHYGKTLEDVRKENSTFAERSEFIACYLDGKMIGFIKMVYVDKAAKIMQILSCNAHFDKRPANSMIAKAVEICASKGIRHFVYGAYVYGTKKNSSITVFKRRNGFEELRFPRYYVPLSLKGKALMASRLHRGIKHILPERVLNGLLDARSYLLDTVVHRKLLRRQPEGLSS